MGFYCSLISIPKADSTFASRFLGFSIYISNTTEKEDGILCYRDTHHTASTIPANVTALCFMVGRYVIYYNTRDGQAVRKLDYSALTQINLCEVVVNGKDWIVLVNFWYMYYSFSVKCLNILNTKNCDIFNLNSSSYLLSKFCITQKSFQIFVISFLAV